MTMKKVESAVIDRRTFFATVGVTLGGAAALSVMPASGLFASPGNVTVDYADTDGLWDTDSVFGHMPPYSHPIGYGRQSAAPVDRTGVHPADLNFLA